MTNPAALELKRTCCHCEKKFGTIRARKQHVKTMHTEPHEESMADIFIEGEMNRAMGIANDDWLEDMLP